LILEKIGSTGRLLGIDQDESALRVARRNLISYQSQLILVHSQFSKLSEIALTHDFAEVDGIIFDLGLSSLQLAALGRGFSFQRDEPLDMRMDASRGLTAAELIHATTEEDLKKIFTEYGEEPFAAAIAREIVRRQKQRPILRTQDLVEVILRAVPSRFHRGRIHPATRAFQALRIAVNDELNELKKTLPQTWAVLKRGGRLVVISFHSLEDRIVKNFFKQEAKDCLCPPELPVCRCQHHAQLSIISKKPILPSASEISRNPRARSAKMRVAQKL
jgi:16S rRNA (cytosine1402-N4)-methyltransferase